MSRDDRDEGLKVALIHAGIEWKDQEKNLVNLLNLNEEAAAAGAQIIVNPEMATSGYVFASREEIIPFAETIPGRITDRFGKIAGDYGCYICIGLPEVDLRTNIVYNAAALIAPSGRVAGKYRKLVPAFKENLWSAEGNLTPLVVETEFGKIGVVICADAYSFKPPRIAALQGAGLLLVPTNWPANYHNPEKYWRARALENGMYVLVCNRTGVDGDMDFSSGETFVINDGGQVLKQVSSAGSKIIYDILPLKNGQFAWLPDRNILQARRPQCYGNMSLATFTGLSADALLDLPDAGEFTLATIQFKPDLGNIDGNWEQMVRLIADSKSLAVSKKIGIDLMVFPELAVTGMVFEYSEAWRLSEEIPGPTTRLFMQKAQEEKVYIVFGMLEKRGRELFNSSVLISPHGIEGVYRKVHLSAPDRGWAQAGERFPVFDLPFGRIGMLIGHDLMFPESAECLAKMGVDILCVPACWEDHQSKFIWEARLGEQMHLAIANQCGQSGQNSSGGESAIYSYCIDADARYSAVSLAEGESINIMQLQAGEARRKKFVENICYDVLLDKGGGLTRGAGNAKPGQDL